MSRFGDDDGYEGPITSEMWWHTVEQALTGKRGLAALRELERALLALPEHKLIEGVIAEASPEQQRFAVCAIGALAWHRRVKQGLSPLDAAVAIARETRGLEDDDETAAYARDTLGLRERLAWVISYANDEGRWGCTDEQRYEHVLAWVRKKIADAERVQAEQAAGREKAAA